MTLVSVVVPVYNVAGYLAQCLDSLISQTHRSLEIVVVDDGSTDGSADICDAYARRDARLTVVHKQNGGLSDARNAGLAAATGEYVMFLDGDDWVDPVCVSHLLSSAVGEAADVVVAGYHVDVEDAEGSLVRSDRRMPRSLLVVPRTGPAPILTMELLNFVGYAWNKLYSRDLLLETCAAFPAGVSLVEDIVFNGHVLGRADRVLFIEKAFVHYMQRPRETLGRRAHANLPLLVSLASTSTRDLLSAWGVPSNRVDEVILGVEVARIRWALRTAAEGGHREFLRVLGMILGDQNSRRILGSALKARWRL